MWNLALTRGWLFFGIDKPWCYQLPVSRGFFTLRRDLPSLATTPTSIKMRFLTWLSNWITQVTRVINHVLDEAQMRGLLLQPSHEAAAPAEVVAGSKKSYRDHVVGEIINTERKYVQDLENLHDLKKTIEQKGVLPGDVVHDIFLNINAILDFQRRFLIKIETTNNLPEEHQEWGLPFTNYEEAFGIYQPFIANQRKAAEIARREFEKIAIAEHPAAMDRNTLDSFLLKPMQRLVKYPLLLKVCTVLGL